MKQAIKFTVGFFLFLILGAIPHLLYAYLLPYASISRAIHGIEQEWLPEYYALIFLGQLIGFSVLLKYLHCSMKQCLWMALAVSILMIGYAFAENDFERFWFYVFVPYPALYTARWLNLKTNPTT